MAASQHEKERKASANLLRWLRKGYLNLIPKLDVQARNKLVRTDVKLWGKNCVLQVEPKLQADRILYRGTFPEL